MHFPTHPRAFGFTLSELLIALAILGVIATFTIPKVLHAQADAEKKALLKETYAALSELTHQGLLSGDLMVDNSTTYFIDRLNAVKICRTNGYTEGCYPRPEVANGAPAVILASGATIVFSPDGCCPSGDGSNHVNAMVDWNGAAGSNLLADYEDAENGELYYFQARLGPGGESPGKVTCLSVDDDCFGIFE